MSVVLRDGVAAHIPNTVRLKNASDGCEFLSARDYSFDTDGCKKRQPLHASWSKDLKSDAPRVAVVLGYFDGQEYVCDQLRSILDQSHSAVHIYLCDDKPVLGETSSLGEVEGIDGVYVVDGACLPVLPAKSHTLTIMANADRIGSAIAKSLRGDFSR